MPSSATATDIDAALMQFPYGQWIAMPDAGRLVRDLGLPSAALTTVVRTGRRRGVLQTRPTPEYHLVRRVYEGPHRRRPTPLSDQF